MLLFFLIRLVTSKNYHHIYQSSCRRVAEVAAFPDRTVDSNQILWLAVSELCAKSITDVASWKISYTTLINLVRSVWNLWHTKHIGLHSIWATNCAKIIGNKLTHLTTKYVYLALIMHVRMLTVTDNGNDVTRSFFSNFRIDSLHPRRKFANGDQLASWRYAA